MFMERCGTKELCATVWHIHHKFMHSKLEHKAVFTLQSSVQADYEYLGEERSGGKPGRDSKNKVPFVASVTVNAQGHPPYMPLAAIQGFNGPAVEN
ncbi:hypothetical protein RIE95_07145 [Acidithiobacillus thiooxidans]|uniref:hypothetical protein n=1 Tax=Acidithiobacillus thiooxidans TaxID=930 RepID=UPI0028588BB5|nr:hypothetical protein [Acidithiobacillus thiooxidans]MDR7926762.1 hypothetical protein [Acidithiobacillus thiooxidans]